MNEAALVRTAPAIFRCDAVKDFDRTAYSFTQIITPIYTAPIISDVANRLCNERNEFLGLYTAVGDALSKAVFVELDAPLMYCPISTLIWTRLLVTAAATIRKSRYSQSVRRPRKAWRHGVRGSVNRLMHGMADRWLRQ